MILSSVCDEVYSGIQDWRRGLKVVLWCSYSLLVIYWITLAEMHRDGTECVLNLNHNSSKVQCATDHSRLVSLMLILLSQNHVVYHPATWPLSESEQSLCCERHPYNPGKIYSKKEKSTLQKSYLTTKVWKLASTSHTHKELYFIISQVVANWHELTVPLCSHPLAMLVYNRINDAARRYTTGTFLPTVDIHPVAHIG